MTASRTLLQRLLACLNFTLDSEDLFCWYKRKKWLLWIMAAAQAAENHGDKWGLTWYLGWRIYTSIPTWTHSQNLLAATEAMSLKIFSYGTALKWSRRPSKSARDSHKLFDETRYPVLSDWKVNGNWDNNMVRVSQWTENHCRSNTSVRRKKETQKSRNVNVRVRDTCRKVNYLSKVVWDRKIITEFTRSRLARIG